MLGTKNRNIKILGAAWLVLGGIFLALALVAFLSVVLGDDPAAQAFEAGDKWWIVVLVLLVLGGIPMVNGLALLRRHPGARLFIAISSLVLLNPVRRWGAYCHRHPFPVGRGSQPMAHVVKRRQGGV